MVYARCECNLEYEKQEKKNVIISSSRQNLQINHSLQAFTQNKPSNG
jgi:hypothetical protein